MVNSPINAQNQLELNLEAIKTEESKEADNQAQNDDYTPPSNKSNVKQDIQVEKDSKEQKPEDVSPPLPKDKKAKEIEEIRSAMKS